VVHKRTYENRVWRLLELCAAAEAAPADTVHKDGKGPANTAKFEPSASQQMRSVRVMGGCAGCSCSCCCILIDMFLPLCSCLSLCSYSCCC